MGNVGGDEGRITTADLQVTSEAAQVSSQLHGVNRDAGGHEGRITTADLQFTSEVRITTGRVLFVPIKMPKVFFVPIKMPNVLVRSLRGAAPGARSLLVRSIVRMGSWAMRAATRAAPPLRTCRFLRSPRL